MSGFLKVRGDDNDSQPLLQRLDDQTIDFGFGTDINARCWVPGDQNLAASSQSAPHNNLLLIAARQSFNRQMGIVRAQTNFHANGMGVVGLL